MAIAVEIETKACTKCGIEYPATLEYFYKKSAKKDGLQSQCKGCEREYRRSEIGKAATKRYLKSEVGKATAERRHATISGYLRDILLSMRQRCNNPKNKNYKYYGGCGIKVCFKSSDEFIDYVMNVLRQDPRGLTIDRINNDGNYERGNIRFVTQAENNKNRRGLCHV